MLSILNENFIGLDSGIKIVRAEINVDTADELPEIDGIEGKKLYQGSVAYIITENKIAVLSGKGKWYINGVEV